MLFCSVPNCKSPNFSKDKLTGKGYCRVHQTQRTDFDRRTIIQKAIAKQGRLETKVRSLHSLPANKEMIQKKLGANDSEMTLYYIKRMNEVEPICDNCGSEAQWIKQPKYYKLWKSAQAHILEKRHFKSIQTHPLNFLTLFAAYSGVCSCHDDYDHDWGRASQMTIWSIVTDRFKILYPLIKENEHQFIPQVLLNSLKY